MPNGKSMLDCRYCVYAHSPEHKWPILVGSRITCLYHRTELPAPKCHAHRFCINIQANDYWYSEQFGAHMFFPFMRQVARFGMELEAGVLYEYIDQIPGGAKHLAVLRVPDLEHKTWKEANGEPNG